MSTITSMPIKTCLITAFIAALLSSIGCSYSKTPVEGTLDTDTGVGWVSLFDGKSLDGWMIKGHAEDVTKGYFYVEDGAIVADAPDADHDYVWCYSEREYTDFHLKLKFQGDRGDYANSGIQVRSRYDHDDEGGWLNGPQIDIGFIDRNGSIWDETRNNQRWLHEDHSPKTFYWSDDTPAWNELEIIVQDMNIKVIQNGEIITDYNGRGILDDRNHIELGVGTAGHIALQIHTGDTMKIRFKDIEILDLSTPPKPDLNILLFSKTAGYKHDSIVWVEEAMRRLAVENNWDLQVERDAHWFTPEGLAQFDVIIWNNNCADDLLLTGDQMTAFEQYIETGGGYVGIHGAAWQQFTPRWDWYLDTLLGAAETNRNGNWEGVWGGDATIKIEAAGDPTTAMIPEGHVWNDEYYALSADIRAIEYPNPDENIEVLLSAVADWDYGDFKTGHPVTWRHPVSDGRMWYTAIGHQQGTIEDPVFQEHLVAGINWASGK